ncbi:MAG TPA: helix-turn-helix domain-containing protein [Anaerolineaceae bacterium]
MSSRTYDIQELVSASGVPRRTVYFYVQQGLLPPPEGAGLAARYGEEHLARLRSIPVLRQRGLRLDEIREQFQRMDLDALRQVVATASATSASATSAPTAQAKQADRAMLENAIFPPAWQETHLTQYGLAPGVALVVQDSLSPVERQRVNQLLQAAQIIFSGGNGRFQFVDATQSGPAGQNSEEI